MEKKTVTVGSKKELKDLIYVTICAYGPGCDLNFIDVSKLTDFSEVFRGLSFTGDISRWDVSQATDMHLMFEYSCFNGDLSHWNVSKVRNMHSMFKNSRFNGDLAQWNVACVEDMGSMFESTCFNQDLSYWNVGCVQNMSRMFCNSSFNGDISRWGVSQVTSMREMFKDSLFCRDISRWNVGRVRDMSGLFMNCPFNLDLSSWDVSAVQNMSEMFKWTFFNGDLSHWDVSAVTEIKDMFYGSRFSGELPEFNPALILNPYAATSVDKDTSRAQGRAGLNCLTDFAAYAKERDQKRAAAQRAALELKTVSKRKKKKQRKKTKQELEADLRYAENQREEDLILSKVEELLSQGRYKKLNVDDLADEVGMPLETMMNDHFWDEDELYRAMIWRIPNSAHIDLLVQARDPKEREPLKLIKKYWIQRLHELLYNRVIHSFFVWYLRKCLKGGLGGHDHDFIYKEMYELKLALDHALAQGQLPERANTARLAETLFLQLLGTLTAHGIELCSFEDEDLAVLAELEFTRLYFVQ